MTYRKEKILIAEKVLGWKYSENELDKKIRYLYKRGKKTYFDDWDPKDDCNCWPEIWVKMNRNQMQLYMDELKKICVKIPQWSDWEINTAQAKICWMALVKSILKDERIENIDLSKYEFITKGN